MTKERKLLYAFGAVIIAGMIAIASFSLGVYVGKQGWTLKQPSMTGPAQPQVNPQRTPQVQPQSGGQGQQPAGGNQDTPRRPDLIGKVINVTAESLEVNTVDGLRSALIDEETIILKQVEGKEAPAQLGDIQRGVRVAIFGQFRDGGRTLICRLIVILELRN